MAGDQAAQFQRIIELVVNPHQTPEQLANGEYSLSQLREIVHRQAAELQWMREGGGGVTYDQVKDFVTRYNPQLPNVLKAVEEVGVKVASLELSLEPTLHAADVQIKELAEYSRKSNEDARARAEQLVKASSDKFGQLEGQHTGLIRHAKDKFEEVEKQQATFLEQARA